MTKIYLNDVFRVNDASITFGSQAVVDHLGKIAREFSTSVIVVLLPLSSQTLKA